MKVKLTKDITLINEDNVEVLESITNVDIVFTSPPYNLGKSSGGGIKSGGNSGKWKNGANSDNGLGKGYDGHFDSMPRESYIKWQKDFISLAWGTLNDTGAIYYNHKPRVQNGLLQTPLELVPDNLLKYLRQIVIWKRAGGINFSPSFYLPTHEWIVILAKPDFRLKSKAASGAKDVWDVNQTNNPNHPAPFPIALPLTAIETTDPKIVLDPYMGSGTTGMACVQQGCGFIGIEKSTSYFNYAKEEILKEVEGLF